MAYLLCKLLNENERTNENVGVRNVKLEGCEVVAVTQLLQQVTNNLIAHLMVQIGREFW